MKKYLIAICNCGRIHMIEMPEMKEMIRANKYAILICSGCGRAAKIHGAFYKISTMQPRMNQLYINIDKFNRYNFTDITLSPSIQKDDDTCLSKIIYSPGIKVPMKTGHYATSYSDGVFSDGDFSLSQIRRDDITVEKIKKIIDKYEQDKTVVDMVNFIHDNPDDVLDEISRLDISSFNWKDTKYEKNIIK